jgi:hypothetical protein
MRRSRPWLLPGACNAPLQLTYNEPLLKEPCEVQRVYARRRRPRFPLCSEAAQPKGTEADGALTTDLAWFVGGSTRMSLNQTIRIGVLKSLQIGG